MRRYPSPAWLRQATPPGHVLVLRPSLRHPDLLGLVACMEVLGIVLALVFVGGRAWNRPADFVVGILCIGYFSGGPLLYFLLGCIFADDSYVGKRDALGRVTSVPRGNVVRIQRMSYTRTYLVGANDSLLFYVRPGSWSNSQLRRLADFLDVPLDLTWKRTKR